MNASSSLSSKAVIATLRFSAWRANRVNADETRSLNAKHFVRDVVKVSQTICDHPALREIYSLQAEARRAHNAITLPAGDDGVRLLPVARQMQHADLMADYRARIDAALATFLAAYPAERAAAPARLNGLYVEAQWPATADEVAARFNFGLRYLPVPEAGQWQDWMAEAAATAQADLTERLRKAVLLVAERLADPDARVFSSLTGNLAELLALVPDLNLASDPKLAEIAAKAQGLLTHDTDTLRDDPTARAETAQQAADIVAMFGPLS